MKSVAAIGACLIGVSLGGTPLLGQSDLCSEASLSHFVETDAFRNETAYKERWRQQLRNRTFDSRQDYQQFTATLPLPNLPPVPVGATSNQVNQAWSEYVNDQAFERDFNQVSTRQMRRMSEQVVQFLTACNPDRLGFFAWIERLQSSNSFRLNLRYRSAAGHDPARVRVRFETTGTLVLDGSRPLDPVSVPNDGEWNITFTRSSGQSVIVEVIPQTVNRVRWLSFQDIPSEEQDTVEELRDENARLRDRINSMDTSAKLWMLVSGSVSEPISPVETALNQARPRVDGVACSFSADGGAVVSCWIRQDGDGPTDYRSCTMTLGNSSQVEALLGERIHRGVVPIGYRQGSPRTYYYFTTAGGGGVNSC